MRACGDCGATIPDDAAFCPTCGRPQSEGATEHAQPVVAPPRAGMRNRILVAVGVLAVVALAVATAVFLLSGRSARGAVVSLTSGQPIVGATILSPEGTATTDGSGYFVLRKLHLGAQVVTVTVDGFPPFEAKLQVRPIGTTETRLKLPDASVTVHVEETAQQPRGLDDAKVTVGGVAAKRVATSTYELVALKPGSADVAVTSQGHESTSTSIPLEPGENEVTVQVELTPAETYVRYFEAFKASRWSDAYAYFHPDIKKTETLAAFSKNMQIWGAPEGMTVEGTRTLPTWTSPATNMSYTDVVEVRRKLDGKSRAGRYSNTGTSYWVNVGGLWLRVDM